MVKIFAHRGFSSAYPENTMLAFREALKIGADGVEFDVQLTSDGVPVIIHDENLLRTGGEDLFVRDLSYATLSNMDVSYRWRGLIPAQRVPTLEEYFALVRDRAFITNIELKNGVYPYPGIEEKVISLVQKFGLEDRVILSSFNHYSLMTCKRLAPKLPCGLLYECRIAEPQEYAKRLGMEYLHPWEIFLDDAELLKYQAAGIRTSPWTVDEPDRIRYFLKKKGSIFALMSNQPDLALKLRAEIA